MNQGGALDAYDDELPMLNTAGVRAFVCLLNILSDAPVYEPAGFSFICLPVPNAARQLRLDVPKTGWRAVHAICSGESGFSLMVVFVSTR